MGIILAIIDIDYDQRLWPKFEKSCFEIRVRKSEVVPIYLDETKVKADTGEFGAFAVQVRLVDEGR
jgi:hypothetical protein